MPELTAIPAAEVAELKERLARLGREKAQLQLIALLMSRLSELPGLEKTVEGMLQIVMDILGGQNVTIYYRIDEVIHCSDVHGKREVVAEIEDDLVRQAFETREFVSRERDFSQTGMMTNEFTKATTWAMPLLVGPELVGVLRIEDLLVAGPELRDEVQTFLRYASLVLKNEISGETRLRRAFDEVNRATRAEAALAAQHATLRGIVEGTPSPIFSVDGEYRYVAFNQSHVSAMRALYGAEIAVGRSLLDTMTVGEDRKKAKENLDRALAGEHLVESAFSGEKPGTRRYFEVSHHPVRADDGSVIGVAVFANDVTERKRAEGRLRKEAERGAVLLDVFIRSPQLSEQQIHEDVLELAVRHTDSTIGFLHRVSDDQKTAILTSWSKGALESCSAVYDTHYPIETAGHWVDCVRFGRPVIYNDFAASPNQKGLPPGHAPMRRFMSVPVTEGGKVRIIFGVGNKAAEYDDDDVFQILQIAGELQMIIEQRRAAERVEFLGRLYRTISEMNQVIVREKNRDRLFAEVCRIGVEHGKFAMVWAGLADLPGGAVRPVAAAGAEAGYVDALNVRLDAAPAELRPAARAILEDRVVVVDDTETNPEFALWREAARRRGFRSCAAFPVRADGIVRGVLAVYAGEPGVFHGEVEALLAELAADLGYALHALETDERRAEAEQALRRSEKSLKEAQRIAHVGSWDLDLERNVLTWSDEIYRIFEIDRSRFGASYEAFLAAIHPDDRAFVDKAYTESVRTRTPYDIVHRLLMPDGRLKYVNERCETFYGEDGRPLRSLGTVQDISERKRAEMEIARVNRALQMLSDTNQALVRITDEATLLREVCRLVVDVGGYRMAWVGFVEHDEARTMRPVAQSGADAGYVESADVTWSDDERGRGPGWTAVRTGQPCITRGVSTDTSFPPWREAAVKRGYGSILSLPLISEGQTLGAMLIYAGEEDAFNSNEVEILKELAGDLAFGITALRTRAKRDQAEEALHKREAELNESQRLAHIGSWDWDAVKDTIWWSAEYYRIYGLDSSQPTLNYVEHLSAYTAESARGLDTVVKRAMETGEPYEIDLELAHPSASTRWVVARGEVKRDAEGRILGLRGTAQNITERRLLEEETRRLNLELESRVEERTAALSEAVKELESFSYSVSHDLRAPLRAVDGFSSLLETQSAGSLDEEGRHLLQTIRRNARQMGRLIDDLLRLSRSSRAELRMATIDMNGLVEEILDEVLPAAERDRTEIQVAKLPAARGDAGLVRVVLQNLLANALKYSAPRERRLIEIGVSPGEDGPEYFVRDNGVGFDPRYADRLFGVFQRLHSAAEFEGTGIGLALVKRIVSRHGGRVRAEGAVDHGATFWFTLGGAGSASGGE